MRWISAGLGLGWSVFASLAAGAVPPARPLVDAGEPYGPLPLVCEINCAASNAGPPFVDYPPGASQVETVLGVPCRVLPPEDGVPKFFAYVLGKEAGLQAGKSYVLTVDYPNDRPRSFQVLNWGCETAMGLGTGPTVGDALKGLYVNHNPESMAYPLSGEMETWSQFFFLHDRFPGIKRPRGPALRPMTPEQGFFVIISQFDGKKDPLSAGAAVSRIRLFEVPDPGALALNITYPPEGLPRRHIFWREEMADGVVAMGHKPEEKDPSLRGVTNPVDWYRYKCELMRFLGINTFCKDLLEFGHNQGWDSTLPGGGGSDWYNQSPTPQLWENILTMLGDYGFSVLPYYEYAGSIGQNREVAIGSQRRCERLSGGKNYTHIPWVQHTNADLADPDFLADAKRLLDYTVVRYKDKVPFLGAWFRPRPEGNPISFNAKDLKRFSAEANGGQPVVRADLQNTPELRERYYQWWFAKRREFLEGLADHLRAQVNPDAFLLYTTDASEPGHSLNAGDFRPEGEKDPWRWKQVVCTDQPEPWWGLLRSPRYADDKSYQFVKVADARQVLAKDAYLKSLLAWPGTWGEYEWQHACPKSDPETYAASDKVMLSYSFNRLYTVASDKAFDTFRNGRGLAMVRHYPLNENEMDHGKEHLLGYYVADVERNGSYCMMAEARAMAYGDPRYLGYLAGNNFNRGFPQVVRAFNAAFLSLPALPSAVLADASSDPEVVVREIATPAQGKWLAVVNTGLSAKKAVAITISTPGSITDAPSGEAVAADEGKIVLNLYPGQLRALRIAPAE